MADRTQETRQAQAGGEAGSAGFGRTGEATERLRGEAVERVEQVGERARRGLDEGKHRVAERLRRLGSTMHSVTEQLPDEDRTVSRYADRLRDQIERAAGYVDSTSINGAFRDIQRLAKQDPALFFGSAFAVGLAVARFLKSRRQGSEMSEASALQEPASTAAAWEAPLSSDVAVPPSTLDLPRAPQEDLPPSGPSSRGPRS